jgi:hypothetical protein
LQVQAHAGKSNALGGSGSPLLSLGDLSNIYVRLYVDQESICRIYKTAGHYNQINGTMSMGCSPHRLSEAITRILS